jgi:hypothetical protein
LFIRKGGVGWQWGKTRLAASANYGGHRCIIRLTVFFLGQDDRSS